MTNKQTRFCFVILRNRQIKSVSCGVVKFQNPLFLCAPSNLRVWTSSLKLWKNCEIQYKLIVGYFFSFFEWPNQSYFSVYWLIAKHSLPPNTKNKAAQNNWLWLLSIHTYRSFQEYLNGFWCLAVLFSWKRLEYPQVIWREINQCHYKIKPRGRSMMRPRSVTIMWLYSVN